MTLGTASQAPPGRGIILCPLPATRSSALLSNDQPGAPDHEQGELGLVPFRYPILTYVWAEFHPRLCFPAGNAKTHPQEAPSPRAPER